MSSKSGIYTTKPVDIEAYQWDGTIPEMYFVIGWIIENGGSAWVQNGAGTNVPEVIRVELKNAMKIVTPGDWVVRDPHGEYSVISNLIFTETYTIKE